MERAHHGPGRRAGLLTMVGGMLGLSVQVSAAALGISALLLASATAFTVLKAVGVAYLVWMGVATLRGARRTLRERPDEDDADPPASPGARAPGT
ncbi:LysE family transporter [Streptomyces sp. NPDC048404]|uniref:LysE family translocator n=1 Tax=unclassified Streptomyces TaxID=2593676 RepID=UPI00342C5B7D